MYKGNPRPDGGGGGGGGGFNLSHCSFSCAATVDGPNLDAFDPLMKHDSINGEAGQQCELSDRCFGCWGTGFLTAGSRPRSSVQAEHSRCYDINARLQKSKRATDPSSPPHRCKLETWCQCWYRSDCPHSPCPPNAAPHLRPRTIPPECYC